MRLSDFILTNLEPILQEWEDFARTVKTSRPVMDSTGLRNHAEYVIRTAALDMRKDQDEDQQIAKSQGLGPRETGESAAETHAETRFAAGFSLEQMISEYRALRSSVLRLWLRDLATNQAQQVADVIRFDEAIDQALAESVATYGRAVETTRTTVLGVLGHDLRSPLSSVLIGGDLIRRNKEASERVRQYADQVYSSAVRASRMVDDLLDLARCNVGLGLAMNLETNDLANVCSKIVNEVHSAHPETELLIELRSTEMIGAFDPHRVEQVISNLIVNAIRHGDADRPIRVTLERADSMAVLEITNYGDPIPREAIPDIFGPNARFSNLASRAQGRQDGLGLGLYIASEIVKGHRGQISVRSAERTGTTFRVELPGF
ncbi:MULTISPECIES: HAMP domain-containing sensor histidine kinase [unclassified Pseudomonas]|uniref:sensor histidine kinase n=1 Tax=unclassified Pseudomonas TaxID=196821 RepID=UPI000D3CC381|nr:MULTISPECIES: HAMP domain-containing sensor histidine kinase [unclassified Pseudomonas]RAU43411.1 sensor histidine kinase [Pseudomonas sp. RIT 409]RAU50052.1 sensor histidine kinase [Pseudomonas sp. RIT 412]